jgi:NhaA family Na+:H+ antiporter
MTTEHVTEADISALTPPISDRRDHIEGPPWASASLVVFGSYGTPASRPLGRLLQQLREAHLTSLRVAWRHLPDTRTHRPAGLALAAEAAATQGRFWSMNRELLAMRHDDPEDLHAAARRAGIDYYELLAGMRAPVCADRLRSDLASARASAVVSVPTLFVNGERFAGNLDAESVWAALQAPAAG